MSTVICAVNANTLDQRPMKLTQSAGLLTAVRSFWSCDHERMKIEDAFARG